MKRILLVVILMLFPICLFACGDSIKDLNIIADTLIFDMTEEEYLIFFYKDGCSYCDKIVPDVVDYQKKGRLPIYSVNLDNGEKSAILRTYKGSDAQGNDKDYFVNGVTKYEDLYVPGTPSLILVTTVNGQKESRFLTEGKTNVINMLEKTKDITKYTVKYKIDEMNTKTISYYAWENALLLNIKKENLLLIGWKNNKTSEIYDNSKVVDDNYELEAVWYSSEYRFIEDKDIYNQKESNYLVYFMKDDCTYCNNIKEDVLKYLYQRSLEKYDESINLYVVNLQTDDYKSEIFRTYKQDGRNYNVDGLTSIQDMYIPSTPTLIEINDGVSSYIGAGSTIIKNALTYYLVEDGEKVDKEKYVISFDLGDGEKLEDIKYYKWDVVSELPTPEKEGYVFSGWADEDGKVITTVANKSITLYAKWLDSKYFREIADYDIFNQQEKEYLVYFMKDGCGYCSKIKEDINKYIQNTYEEKYSNALKLYIVNLKTTTKRSEILRSYTGEGGEDDGKTYVTGVEKWDELYIPSTPTLIKISFLSGKGVASLEAIGSTNVVNKLDKYLENKNNVGLRDKYCVTFNLNYETDEKIENLYFYNVGAVLPTAKREGYIFVGWEENGKLIDEVSTKNYDLKARWAKNEDVLTIKLENLFEIDNELYYVLFISKRTSKHDELLELIIPYQQRLIEKNTDKQQIYVCYIEDGDVRTAYKGEGGEGYNNAFYISNATSYDQFRIPYLPCLVTGVKIPNSHNYYQMKASFATETIKVIKEITQK